MYFRRLTANSWEHVSLLPVQFGSVQDGTALHARTSPWVRAYTPSSDVSQALPLKRFWCWSEWWPFLLIPVCSRKIVNRFLFWPLLCPWLCVRSCCLKLLNASHLQSHTPLVMAAFLLLLLPQLDDSYCSCCAPCKCEFPVLLEFHSPFWLQGSGGQSVGFRVSAGSGSLPSFSANQTALSCSPPSCQRCQPIAGPLPYWANQLGVLLYAVQKRKWLQKYD